MEKRGSVCAVLVTYNRKKYLIKLLEALSSQSYRLDGIIVFDNCSNDGTAVELLDKGYCVTANEGMNDSVKGNIKIHYFRNYENSGGSGGFYRAFKIAVDLEYQYLWVMDDDVMPQKDCLERMMEYQSGDCRICVPNRTGNGFQDYAIVDVDLNTPFVLSIDKWKKKIRPDQIQGNCIEVRDMVFEGPLIKADLVKEIGLPEKNLFILFDDSSYALRACKETKILFVKDAVMLKQIVSNKKTAAAPWKIYYCFRNAVWFNKKYGVNFGVKNIRPLVLCAYWGIKYLLRGHMDYCRLVIKGYKDGKRSRLGKTLDPQLYKEENRRYEN